MTYLKDVSCLKLFNCQLIAAHCSLFCFSKVLNFGKAVISGWRSFVTSASFLFVCNEINPCLAKRLRFLTHHFSLFIAFPSPNFRKGQGEVNIAFPKYPLSIVNYSLFKTSFNTFYLKRKAIPHTFSTLLTLFLPNLSSKSLNQCPHSLSFLLIFDSKIGINYIKTST